MTAQAKNRGITYANRFADQATFLHLGHWDDVTQPDSDLRSAQQRLNQHVLAMTGFEENMSVLDVGCGPGGTLLYLADKFPQMSLTGIDIGVDLLRLVQDHFLSTGVRPPKLVRADACALPFPAQNFDRIVCIEAAFHFSSRLVFLQEAHRLLKPKGALVLSDIYAGEGMSELAATQGPAFAVGALLQAGLGPWFDFWGEQPCMAESAEAVGFRTRGRVDATRNTLPSYQCFYPDRKAVAGAEWDMDLTAAAVVLLGWLQEQGMIRVEYLALER